MAWMFTYKELLCKSAEWNQYKTYKKSQRQNLIKMILALAPVGKANKI